MYKAAEAGVECQCDRRAVHVAGGVLRVGVEDQVCEESTGSHVAGATDDHWRRRVVRQS